MRDAAVRNAAETHGTHTQGCSPGALDPSNPGSLVPYRQVTS